MDAGGRIAVGGFAVWLCLRRGLWQCLHLLLVSGGTMVRFCFSLELEMLEISL